MLLGADKGRKSFNYFRVAIGINVYQLTVAICLYCALNNTGGHSGIKEKQLTKRRIHQTCIHIWENIKYVHHTCTI